MEIIGVVHVHSTYSYDSKESLQSLKTFLREKGISFCCLTEHTDKLTLHDAQIFVQECKAVSDSTFSFIAGFEVPYKNAHMLLLGTEVFLGQYADAQMLKTWSNASVLTILAHPVRNRFALDSVMEEVIDGVEIWNQQYDGKLVPRTRSVKLFKTLQKKIPSLLATGGLDFHRKEHFGSPVYSLSVDVFTREAILSALKNGAYTFGNAKAEVSSFGLWRGYGSKAHVLKSALSIAVIVAGKSTNKLFAYLGIKLPRSLKQLIRSRV